MKACIRVSRSVKDRMGFSFAIVLNWKKLLLTTLLTCLVEFKEESKKTQRFLTSQWQFAGYIIWKAKNDDVGFTLVQLEKMSCHPAFDVLKTVKNILQRKDAFSVNRQVELCVICIAVVMNVILEKQNQGVTYTERTRMHLPVNAECEWAV